MSILSPIMGDYPGEMSILSPIMVTPALLFRLPLQAVRLLAVLLLGFLSATVASAEEREIVILYTNDFHSAIDPIPAYWLPRAEGEPMQHLGGAAELMTLVESIRAEEEWAGNPVFLFDAGDMFTGMLAKLTSGEAMMEMMLVLGYDAFGIGNHEFDYGWRSFREQMFRMPYPSLGANIFYAGGEIPFSQPHAIIEKDGIRLGVIGVIGQDARSAILPSNVTELDFRDPAPAIERSIAALENDVDLIVVLAHQGHTGPQQTDAEAHPEVQRDFDADIELCGAVPGIDVFIGGHAHRGIEVPYVHPRTGSIIVQTYGYGTRLGYLRVRLDTGTDGVVSHEGELLKVWSDDLEPNPVMRERMAVYQERVAPIIGEAVGETPKRLTRRYNAESLLGAFATDVLRQVTGAEVAFINAGGLRADLPRGEITKGNVQDAFPFQDTPVVIEMTGADVLAVLEQGMTLLRGMVQASGLEARYDLERPVGDRIVAVSIGGEPLDRSRVYRVATNSFLAQGGDLYEPFTHGVMTDELDYDTAYWVIEHLRGLEGFIEVPEMGRLVPVGD